MSYRSPDREYGPFQKFLTLRIDAGLLTALRGRADAEQVDRAYLIRRILRAGVADEFGQPITPPSLPVVIDV